MDRSCVIEGSRRVVVIVESSSAYVYLKFRCRLYQRARRVLVRGATCVHDVWRGAVFRAFRRNAGAVSVSLAAFSRRRAFFVV